LVLHGDKARLSLPLHIPPPPPPPQPFLSSPRRKKVRAELKFYAIKIIVSRFEHTKGGGSGNSSDGVDCRPKRVSSAFQSEVEQMQGGRDLTTIK